MKSRFLRFASLFLLSLFLVTACNGRTFITSKPELPPLRIAYNLWPGYFPMEIASEQGFFAEQGVEVEPVYSENYLGVVSDFSAGKYDGIIVTLGGVMSIIGKNPDIHIVLETDQSAGADTVVVQRDIKSVVDLKGKRLGVKLGDYGELFVVKMLESNGLTTDDVTLVDIEGEAIPAHIKSGDIQAGQTWYPYTLEAVKAGAQVLFTSKQTPRLIPNVILFRSNVIRDRPGQIKAFVRAWFQAQDYWKANPEASKSLIAKRLKIKPESVSTDNIQLSTLKENLKAFTPGSTEESLYHTAKLYADFSIRTGGLTAAPDIQKLIDPSFVQQLQPGS
ncbi:ABC transporter substrate-binding protein [Trichocoleus sp. DQ-A3]|uniref:ABC transporter substrate-binding protein n=1 Tax=Cyanophyceae TaxID=3028117 RepID=UPI001686B67E|nr:MULTISPECIES: ABC transporter substrate-binding protein [unclassified Coleofasciculus]MBD1902242.1 ABC transporter substrate-binding protein [Coleofasciculus sp. FACHB-125]MBD2538784.1 ABC transporter substrate-binding protein [Coleofasciculus sp. FACHB-SPT36]